MPVLLVFVLLGACGCHNNKCGTFFVSNDICSVGLNLANSKDNANSRSNVLIGIPMWIGAHTRICGVAFSPSCLIIDEINGMSISSFSLFSLSKGFQIGGMCIFSGNTSGVVIAPVSFVGGGDCLQIGAIASNGLGRGSNRVFAQISLWNYAHESAVNGPSFQIGMVNNDFSYTDNTKKKNIQIGFVNHVACQQYDINNKRRWQFGIINYYHDDSVKNEICLVQVGILNFRNRLFIPFCFW